jgi:hypothetical protein
MTVCYRIALYLPIRQEATRWWDFAIISVVLEAQLLLVPSVILMSLAAIMGPKTEIQSLRQAFLAGWISYIYLDMSASLSYSG